MWYLSLQSSDVKNEESSDETKKIDNEVKDDKDSVKSENKEESEKERSDEESEDEEGIYFFLKFSCIFFCLLHIIKQCVCLGLGNVSYNWLTPLLEIDLFSLNMELFNQKN